MVSNLRTGQVNKSSKRILSMVVILGIFRPKYYLLLALVVVLVFDHDGWSARQRHWPPS